MLKRTSIHERGFTLMEVAIALAVFALLVAAAVPAMSRWVSNAKVRTTADSLQNALRLAQEESLRRSRQVTFSLTSTSWSINTIPSLTGETGELIESGTLTTTTSGVTVTGPAAICFNSMGRLVTISTASCSAPTTDPPVLKYQINLNTADRQLRVDVTLGGQVHLCDPLKTLSSDNPDACATS